MKFHNPLDTNLGCGGTILDSKTILTAAHCLSIGRTFIVAGITNTGIWGEHSQMKYVESFTPHQDYDPGELVI